MPYKDPEKAKENQRRYREKHREEINIRNREWRLANYAVNRDKINSARRKYYHQNIEKMRAYGRTRKNAVYRQNPEVRKHCREMVKKKRAERRMLCLAHYSSGTLKCGCCSEGSYEFLSIDHINGGGHKHRLEIGGAGSSIYHWLISQGFPEGYRVLCYNCNCSIGYYGYCPHQEKKCLITT